MNSKDAETPITSFTLSKLIAMSGGEKRPGPLGECIATSSAAQMEVFRFPGRLDAFVIGVGTEGETTFTSNLKEYRLKKDRSISCKYSPTTASRRMSSSSRRTSCAASTSTPNT